MHSAIPGLLVLLPLGLGLVTLLDRAAGSFWRWCLPGLLLQVGLTARAVVLTLDQGLLSLPVGPWADPVGLGLRLDGMALVFVVLSTVVVSLCGLQARAFYTRQDIGIGVFWPLYWWLWAGLNLVWLARDLFSLYVGMEVIACCATGLIAHRAHAASFRVALGYFQAVLLGTLVFLVGAGLLFVETGSFALVDLARSLETRASPSAPVRVGLLLITVGLIYRAALFPLHTWLPPAHGTSRPPISALLSAMVTKASFYILLRVWLEMGPQMMTPGAAQALGWMGALAVFWGGWMAWRQPKLKMLVAYSSVSQIGYFFLFFPFLLSTSDIVQLARDAVVLQIVSHALAKAAIFLAAGNLIAATASERVDGLAGVSRSLPLSLFSFGLAGVSLMGLPPSGGFAAKWTYLQAAIAAGQWWWLPVLLGGGLMSAAYIFRVYRESYRPRPEDAAVIRQAGVLEVVPLLFALMALGLGLVSLWPLQWLEVRP